MARWSVIPSVNLNYRTPQMRTFMQGELTLTVAGLAADSRLAGGTSPPRWWRMLAVLTMCGGAMAGTMLLRALGLWGALMVMALAVSALASICT
jgi:hypothetical protein